MPLANGMVMNASSHDIGLGGYLTSFREITDIQRSQQESERQRQKIERANVRLRDALESIGEGFALFDKDDKLILANDLYKSANPAAAHLMTLGRPRKDIIEAMTHGGDIIGVEDWIDSYDRETSVGDTSSPRRYEVHHSDGRVFLASRGRTAEGGCTITWLDITQLRASERAEREADEFIRAIVEASPTTFMVSRLESGEVVYCPPEMREKLKAGQSTFEFFLTEQDRDDYLKELKKNRRLDDHPVTLRDLDGEVFKSLSSARLIDYKGEDLVVSSTRDITEQLAIEAERQAVQQRELAAVTDAIQALGDGIALYDADFKFVMGNQRFYETWFDDGNVARPEPGEHVASVTNRLLDVGFLSMPEGMGREHFAEALMDAARSYASNVVLETFAGTFSCNSHPAGVGGYLIEFNDITEQLAIENERRIADERALAKLTDTVQSLDLALVLLDSDLNFVFCNQRHLEIYHQEVAAPEVGEPMSSIMRRLVTDDFYDDETETEALIERRLDIIRNATQGYEVKTRDGLILMGSVHRTPDAGYLISLMDITEQRRAETELEHQREVTHQNEKLSAMGELLAGVAHELNNPLSIVVGYAMMLQNNVDDPKLRRQIDNVAQAAERCSRIVKAFLAMARQRPAELKRCSLNELVLAALDMVGQRLRGSGIEVTLDLAPDLPDVEADEDQIIQVFTNLLINAEQALVDRPTPRNLHLRSFLDKKADKAVVRVADNGPGIPVEAQPRIFEPFFTTKKVGTGTGIGLAFCHRVVASHGGRMTVRSAPDRGARFYVRLGLSDQRETLNPVSASAMDSHQGRVLVVDDEEGVAQLIGDILQDAGYEIEIANSPFQALDLLDGQTFDALISDMRMPGLDGPEFFDALAQRDPQLAKRTGFVTGDTLSKDVAAFLSKTDQPHLEKPVTPPELLGLVAALIAQRRT